MLKCSSHEGDKFQQTNHQSADVHANLYSHGQELKKSIKNTISELLKNAISNRHRISRRKRENGACVLHETT